MEQSWGALRGLRVLDGASLYAAPFIATLLADHGADVVKVEPPGGDDYRHYPTRMWPILARNKRSIVLDLRNEQGCAEFRSLARSMDVVVMNLPARTLLARGLDYETLSADNPGLIMVHVSGFGLDGPYSDRPGNGTMGEAYGGLTHMTGDPSGAPMLASVPLGDAVTAAFGAFGVLAACYHKLAHGGQGQLIDVNPVDAVLHLIGPVLTSYDGQGPAPIRAAGGLPGSTVRNVFATSDAKWVAISCSTSRHVDELAVIVGHDGTSLLEPAVSAWTSTLDRTTVVQRLVDARIPCVAVNDAADLAVDPHLVARRSLVPVATSEWGPVTNPAPAPRLLGTPGWSEARTPDVDEHGDAIRQESRGAHG